MIYVTRAFTKISQKCFNILRNQRKVNIIMIYTVILQNAGLSRKLNKILFVRRRFFINIRKLFEN